MLSACGLTANQRQRKLVMVRWALELCYLLCGLTANQRQRKLEAGHGQVGS